jgi:hypothetical protein
MKWAAIVIVATVGGCNITVLYGMPRFACAQLERATQVPTKYDFLAGGCFVKTPGGWIPEDRWRSLND